MSAKYKIELVRTPGGRQLAYIVHNGERVAVSNRPVSAEEAQRFLREKGICRCGGLLFRLTDGSLFCLNCENPEGEP